MLDELGKQTSCIRRYNSLWFESKTFYNFPVTVFDLKAKQAQSLIWSKTFHNLVSCAQWTWKANQLHHQTMKQRLQFSMLLLFQPPGNALLDHHTSLVLLPFKTKRYSFFRGSQLKAIKWQTVVPLLLFSDPLSFQSCILYGVRKGAKCHHSWTCSPARRGGIYISHELSWLHHFSFTSYKG